jgi:class 3 adenylate cyclase
LRHEDAVDIAAWLSGLGLERYVEAFEANHIDAAVLRTLNTDDLKELGVTSLGHRKKMLDAIAQLRELAGAPTATLAKAGTVATPRDAERRQLTVLFCDIVDSTEVAARLDPEDLRDVMRAYQAACADVVRRFEGYLARFLGDGVLAYFGWPQAHEDDAERAVRAGLQLVQDVARLEPRVGIRLQARIGVATGHVVVGDLISEGISDKDAVIGETPNLAARLQAVAPPGGIVISQATRRLVGGLFELDDLGRKQLKGFAAPVLAWQVKGEGRAEGRFEALHGEYLTWLVGREHELGILLERWARAMDGDGQVVLLSGESGIGKSRLVRELRERIAAERHLRVTHQCSPYHQTSPLRPVLEHLEPAAGFERDDRPRRGSPSSRRSWRGAWTSLITPRLKHGRIRMSKDGQVGQLDEAWSMLSDALRIAEESGQRYYEAETYRFEGKLHLLKPRPDVEQAEASFQRALDIAWHQQAKSWELRAAMSLARLWRDQGKRAQARDMLAPVYGWFTEGFETADLKDAKALLEGLA